MNRPRFETDADKRREELVARTVAAHTGLKMFKLPDLDKMDWICYRPKIVFEVKCRRISSTSVEVQSEGLFLSKKKWLAGIVWTHETIPFDFVILYGLLDGVFAFKYKPERQPPKVEWRGRNENRDGLDFEDMALIPVEWIVKISSLNVWEETP